MSPIVCGEYLALKGGSNTAPGARSNQGKGKGVADDQVRAPVRMRVLYQQHFENIAHEEPCAWDCTMPDCVNRVRTDMVRVGPSNLLRGESGVFARETIIEGTVVACFGAVRELRKGPVPA